MDLPWGCAGRRLETPARPIYSEGARAIVRLLLDLASPAYEGIEGRNSRRWVSWRRTAGAVSAAGHDSPTPLRGYSSDASGASTVMR
jgi:hypothetical protein